MVDIAELTGNTGNQTRYSDLANEYFEFWTEHGINSGGEPPHSMLGYDRPDTYGEFTKPLFLALPIGTCSYTRQVCCTTSSPTALWD